MKRPAVLDPRQHRRAFRRRRTVIWLVALVLLLAGCGTSPGAGQPGNTDRSSTSPPTGTPSSTPGSTPPSTPPTPVATVHITAGAQPAPLRIWVHNTLALASD